MTEQSRWDDTQLRGRLGILQAAATLMVVPYNTKDSITFERAVSAAYSLWDAVCAEDERRIAEAEAKPSAQDIGQTAVLGVAPTRRVP